MLTKRTTAVPQRSSLTAYEVLRGEMDRLFNDWLAEFSGPLRLPAEQAMFQPRFDVKENDQELLVTAELPGMAAKDVEVELDHGMLVVKGRKDEEKEEKGDTFYSRERRFGSFERQIAMPWETAPDSRAEASFKDGVLRVTVPRPKEAPTPRTKVAVKAS